MQSLASVPTVWKWSILSWNSLPTVSGCSDRPWPFPLSFASHRALKQIRLEVDGNYPCWQPLSRSRFSAAFTQSVVLAVSGICDVVFWTTT